MADEIKNKKNAQDDASANAAEPAEAGLPAAEPGELEAKLAVAEQQRDEYLSGWQRAKADFINYKKDEMKRSEEAARYGSQDLIKEIITIMDDFDLALRVIEKNGGANGVDKGIYLIRSKIEDVLKKRGLEKIMLKPGDDFDPSFAEAMLEVPSEHPPGAIVEEIEPGYRLHDKIIRPARVIISKGNEK
jgi:molecular chaperone GrpE